MKSDFSFRQEEFAEIFPFYLLLNRNMEIISCGKSLQQMFSGCEGNSFANYFRIEKPFITSPDLEKIEPLKGKPIIFSVASEEQLQLSGKFEQGNNQGELLFIGAELPASVKKSAYKEDIELLALAASANNNGILFLNPDLTIKWINPAFEKITGFTSEDIIGKRPDDLFFGPETDPQVITAIKEKDKKKENFTFEFKHYKKDGSVFWSKNNTVFIEDAAGEKKIRLVVIEDITEKKQNEERLRILSQIAEDNVNAVVITDVMGRVTWANKSFAKMTGYSFEEIEGRKPGHLLQGKESDPAAIAYLNKKIMSGEPFTTEIINYSKNGTKYWVRIQGQPIQNLQGELAGFFAIEEDITQEKEIQKKLKESEQQLRHAMEIIGDNVWEHDFTTGITTFSKSDHALLGITNENVAQNASAWWNSVHEEDRDLLVKTDHLYKQGLIDHHSLEYRIVHKSGAIKWVLDRGVVIEKHANGKPIRNIGTHTEITSIKEIEAALRKSQQVWNFALESSGVCVWEYDFEKNRGTYSSQYAQMLGFEKDEIQDDYDWMQHVHPDDKQLLRQNELMYLYKMQTQHSQVFRLRCKDGSYKWILDRGMLIEKSADDRPLHAIGTHTDITHIKLTETKLANSVRQFQSLSENIPGVIYEYEFRADGTEGLRYISPAIERLFGLKTEEFKNYIHYIHPDDRAKIIQKNKHCKITLEPFYDESRLVINGKIYWHSVHSSFSYQTENGNSVYTGFMLDITERKNVEEKLERQRRFYEDILNNIPADLAVFNSQHQYLFVNPNAVPDEELRKWILGKKDEDYCIYKNKPLSIAENRRRTFNNVIRSKNPAEWEEKLQLNGEKEKHMLRRLFPLLDNEGKVSLVIGYGLDITERKLAEESIRRSEEKYRMIINNMNLSLVEVDKTGAILFANQSFCKISGYEMDEVLGKETFTLLLGDAAPAVRAEITRRREEGVADAYELAIKNKRGELKWWLVSGGPIFDEFGRFNGSIGIHLDITEQKKLEQELRIAKKEAEESALAKEIFLANMSHEIRTPMNAITGMSRQLSKTVLDEKQKSYLHAISTASENLLVIINDILDFSKIESGKLVIERIGFRLKDIIKQCTQVVEYKVMEKGLSFQTSVNTAISEVLIGDPYRLNQVLLNLISNSIKFTEKGFVNVTCTLGNKTENEELIHITVSDTGVGMSEEFMDNLFTKFTQEDESITRRFGGTGLGMSISKQLIEMMGGEIRVESRKGQGTDVYISIPFETGNAADIPEKEILLADNSILKGSRILLAEDNEMNRFVANTILEQYGAIIENAENGKIAVERLQSSTYDLVLMDVRMPEMDGLEATKNIRKNISTVIPIIALTANALKVEQDKCIKAGMNDFLAKPFQEEDLVRVIAKWLGKEVNLSSVKITNIKDQNIPMYSLEKIKTISRGNMEFVKKMMQIFISESMNAVQLMKENFESKDYDKIKSLAHKMKPSVMNMGVDSITPEILFMESMDTTEENLDRLRESLEKTAETIHKVVEEMKLELKNMG